MTVTSPILVTGAAGFVGSHYVDTMLAARRRVVSVDKLSYAGDILHLEDALANPRHTFVQCGVEDSAHMAEVLRDHAPSAIVHFAAESHVDRSIDGPRAFLENNTVGTFELLESARAYWAGLADDGARARFRFIHISTDEVYGATADAAYCEDTPFCPSSPYAASKAAAECFVNAYVRTHALPCVVVRLSNIFGPRQLPEKLIPLMITRALAGATLPVYGDGRQRRQWLFVDDACAAIARVMERGAPGRAYNLVGGEEHENLMVVDALCRLLDARCPAPAGGSYAAQIGHVEDRLGHDRRYWMDGGRARRELGWQPEISFADGLSRTVDWYLAREDELRGADWVKPAGGHSGARQAARQMEAIR